jgi:CspA family cold shock protein
LINLSNDRVLWDRRTIRLVFEMSDEGASHGTLVGRGAVKWFDPVKGYGFVEAPEHNGEILLHISPLRAFGLSSVAKAVEIEFEFEKTAKGARIVKVLDVIQPEASISVSDLTDEEFESLEPAIVKWFDASRGFGFVCLFGTNEEVFFHSGVVEKSEVSDAFPGLGMAVGVDRQGERPSVAYMFEWASAAGES